MVRDSSQLLLGPYSSGMGNDVSDPKSSFVLLILIPPSSTDQPTQSLRSLDGRGNLELQEYFNRRDDVHGQYSFSHKRSSTVTPDTTSDRLCQLLQ